MLIRYKGKWYSWDLDRFRRTVVMTILGIICIVGYFVVSQMEYEDMLLREEVYKNLQEEYSISNY